MYGLVFWLFVANKHKQQSDWNIMSVASHHWRQLLENKRNKISAGFSFSRLQYTANIGHFALAYKGNILYIVIDSVCVSLISCSLKERQTYETDCAFPCFLWYGWSSQLSGDMLPPICLEYEFDRLSVLTYSTFNKWNLLWKTNTLFSLF